MGKRIVSKLRPILMSLLIAAAVTFTVLCITTAIISDTATVKAESVEHSHEGYTAWTSTTSLPDLAGSYYLTADVTIASGTWIVPTGTTCLCLNGHGIIGNNGNSVITVGSGAVLYLEDCLDTAHKYTVDANHLATVDDSLEGVEGVDYFTFTGGYITGAKRTANNSVGGGVNIEGGTLYINGGTIIGNSADRGGGVRCGGTLVMNGGAIRNNNANTASGGGQRNGGGLFINTTFTMNGGIITENWCANAGGAILLQSTATSFIMNGGAIVNNYNRGLSNNMAQKPVKIGSGAIIEGNVDEDGNPCDIWLLQSGNKIELLGELSNNKPIGVYMGTATGTFTSGLSGKGTAVNFISTNDAYFVKLNGDGEAQLAEKVVSVTVGETVTYYDNVSDALSAWGDGCTLTLLKDVSITSTINIEEVTKTLDLNGHGIKMTGTGRVFTVINGATFNITDGNPQIEHKFTVSNGLATVNDNLTGSEGVDYLTFTGGYITGGNAKGGDENGWGGCLVVSLGGKRATLNISGGTIIGNRCDMSGAAIRVGGDKNDCTVFNMTGGAIMYNTAGQGGAVTWESNVIVKISGGVIDNNFVGSNEVNVYLEDGQKITVDTAFTAAASIGVKLQKGQGVFTSGWATSMEDADPSDYFTSDAGYYVFSQNGEAVIADTLPHIHFWNYKADGNVITATCVGEGDCNLSEQTLTITADGKSYDGTAVTAQLSLSDGWTTVNGLEIPSIYYSDGVNAATTTAPVSVGTYTASITVGEKTATVEFEITRKTEAKIDDKTGDEENNVTVVGLDLELSSIEDENPDANSISLVMTVEAKTEETAVKAASIIETAKNKSLEFFEVKIEKTIDSITTVLDTTSNVLEIAVPYEKVNKRGLIVYSYHDGVRTFVESDAKEDGTFRVDKENKLIYVYANKFSTYAIGYTPYYRVQTSLSLGSYEGKASVTIKNDADENISFTLESADAKNIVFPDVPKGQYTMTIIWEDGKTNTLTMTLTVGPKAVLSAITEQDAESETSEEQVEEQETQVYSPYIGTTDEYEVLTEDAKIETVAAADSYVAYKAQAINREVGIVPRKREYMTKREFIFYI